MAVKTSAARMTPSGSAMTDSLSSVERTLRLTRTFCKMGVITVGPVTETIAPKSRLNSQDHPSSRATSRPASTVVINNPTLTSPTTARDDPQRHAEQFRLDEPQHGRAEEEAGDEQRPGRRDAQTLGEDLRRCADE